MTSSPLTVLFRDAPMTCGIALAAVLVTLHAWTGGDLSSLTLRVTADALQPWRYVTSILVHIDILHLGFNLVWLCYFGVILERALGAAALLALAVLFAVGSAAAEFAVASGVVGLSGVVFGQLALLAVLSKRDPRFAGSVGSIVLGIFIGWLGYSVVTAMAGTFHVGIVGHVTGVMLGLILGLALSTQTSQAVAWRSLLAVSVMVCIASAVVARPHINFTAARADELAAEAEAAIERGDYEHALVLYSSAIELNSTQARYHYELGIALADMDRMDEALEALQRAAQLEQRNALYQAALNENLAWKCARDAEAAFQFDDYEQSALLYEQCIAHDPSNPALWFSLGSVLVHMEEYERAAKAYRRSLDLDPMNADLAEAVQWAEAWALAVQAHAALLAEEYQRSVELYRHAMRTGEHVYEWWVNLGDALLGLGDFRGARNAYERALLMDPRRQEAQTALDWLEENVGDVDGL